MPSKKLPTDPARKRLSLSERKFVQEYLRDGNGTRAYQCAHPGVSHVSAKDSANDLLNRPHVKAEIDAANEHYKQRRGITATNVLDEIARIAHVDPADFFDESGNLRGVRDIPRDSRVAISGIDVSVERVVARTVRKGKKAITTTTFHTSVSKIRLWSKPDALATLARRLGLVKELSPLDTLMALLPPPIAKSFREYLANATTQIPSGPERNGKQPPAPSRV